MIYYQDETITLYHGDALEVLQTLPDDSVHAVVTDPPYGYGIDTWDVSIDVPSFTQEATRLATEFYTVFGQMPGIRTFDQAAIACGLHFCEHIVWVKRHATPGCRLSRGHESIYVYAIGKRKQFYKTTGRYEDIKLPGLLTGVTSIQGIDRYIKDLWRKVHGHDVGKICGKTRQTVYDRYGSMVSDRSPEFCNYSNAWSFLSPMLTKRNGEYKHPTEKPMELMMRLIEMCSPEGAVILDPFAGSGTTLVGARNLGRRAIGIEQHEPYCETIVQRLAQRVMPLFEKETEA